MHSFLVSCGHLCSSLYVAWREADFRNTVILAVLLILLGTVLFRWLENWGWIDSLYFCVTTLNMVGYGDVAPETDAGKIATIIYSIIGIAIFLRIIQRIVTPMVVSEGGGDENPS